jgi:hypothetical protein
MLGSLTLFLAMASVGLAQAPEPAPPAPGTTAMIEDFELELTRVPDVKTGWESNGGPFSTATITRIAEAKAGVGAGEVGFDVKPGGWALVQKKVEGADWLGRGPKAISFWLKGGGSGKMTVELEESYTFKWRKEVPLTGKDWQKVTIKFSEFACTEKPAMSPADLVAVKFVCFDGAQKLLLDDIQVEFNE